MEQIHLLGRGDHPERRSAPVEDVLHGKAPQAAARPPDEDLVALGHLRPVVRDEHPVGGRIAQGVDRRLFPAQVGRFGHQLVGFDHRDIGQAAEVRLEAPDALVGGQHGVVMGRGVLIVDVVAVDRDLVADLPVAHGRTGAQHHTRGIRADDVVVERVAPAPDALPAQAVQEAEGGKRLEDRGPHRVEVDGGGHDGHVGLVGGQFGQGHLLDVERGPGVLLRGLHPGEHLGLRAPHHGRPVGVGQGQAGQLVGGCACEGGAQDVAHVPRR